MVISLISPWYFSILFVFLLIHQLSFCLTFTLTDLTASVREMIYLVAFNSSVVFSQVIGELHRLKAPMSEPLPSVYEICTHSWSCWISALLSSDQPPTQQHQSTADFDLKPVKFSHIILTVSPGGSKFDSRCQNKVFRSEYLCHVNLSSFPSNTAIENLHNNASAATMASEISIRISKLKAPDKVTVKSMIRIYQSAYKQDKTVQLKYVLPNLLERMAGTITLRSSQPECEFLIARTNISNQIVGWLLLAFNLKTTNSSARSTYYLPNTHYYPTL